MCVPGGVLGTPFVYKNPHGISFNLRLPPSRNLCPPEPPQELQAMADLLWAVPIQTEEPLRQADPGGGPGPRARPEDRAAHRSRDPQSFAGSRLPRRSIMAKGSGSFQTPGMTPEIVKLILKTSVPVWDSVQGPRGP